MSQQRRILIVDDDPLVHGSLAESFQAQSYSVATASDGLQALQVLERGPVDVVVTDLKMPKLDGLELLARIRDRYPQLPVIILTGFGDVPAAVEAMRRGASDFLTKPIQPEELDGAIQRALEEAPEFSTRPLDDPFAHIVGEHASVLRIFEMVRMVASTPATVLLDGESGTGKRLVAHAIHRADPKRHGQSFIEVSCGALPETLLESELFGHVRGAFTGAIRDKQGRFELADGGTIFLDEIDGFSPALQGKLLRVLQERTFEHVGDAKVLHVDVRIIAATNRNLESMVKEGKFREDLFYRLNVISMHLPPLRERASDIPRLVDYFLKRVCAKIGKVLHGVSDEAMQLLTAYHWPGNVRELENMIERMAILAKGSRLGADDVPEVVRAGASNGHSDGAAATPAEMIESTNSLKSALQDPEREIILKTLAEVRWNRSLAAKRLGIHRSTLYHKLRKLSVDPHQLRG